MDVPGFPVEILNTVGAGDAFAAKPQSYPRRWRRWWGGLRSGDRGGGGAARRVSARGVYVAWLFFMLFALSVAMIWVALALSGLAFEDAMLFTISALSTTGPLAPVVSEGALEYATLGTGPKSILIAAMVLGRLETLVLIAMLNAEFWRG